MKMRGRCASPGSHCTAVVLAPALEVTLGCGKEPVQKRLGHLQAMGIAASVAVASRQGRAGRSVACPTNRAKSRGRRREHNVF